jgi:hypothetical protein
MPTRWRTGKEAVLDMDKCSQRIASPYFLAFFCFVQAIGSLPAGRQARLPPLRQGSLPGRARLYLTLWQTDILSRQY